MSSPPVPPVIEVSATPASLNVTPPSPSVITSATSVTVTVTACGAALSKASEATMCRSWLAAASKSTSARLDPDLVADDLEVRVHNRRAARIRDRVGQRVAVHIHRRQRRHHRAPAAFSATLPPVSTEAWPGPVLAWRAASVSSSALV